MSEQDEDTRPGPWFGDVRDDYDDGFRQEPTREDLCRRLAFPGVIIALFGIGGVVGASVLVPVLVMETFFHLSQPTTPGQVAMFPVAVMGLLAAGGWMLATAVGGLSMMRLRAHPLAVLAALTFTLLTPFGFVTVVLIPLGIWALVLLSDPLVKREFLREGPSERRSGEVP